ncbi:hypothetical protein D9M70_482140 [compost metagenome]
MLQAEEPSCSSAFTLRSGHSTVRPLLRLGDVQDGCIHAFSLELEGDFLSTTTLSSCPWPAAKAIVIAGHYRQKGASEKI